METLLGRSDLPKDVRQAIRRILADHERERAALAESEARLRGILDHSPTINYIKDTGGRYLYVNRRYEELVGRSSASIVGQRAEDLFPPGIAALYTQHDERVLSSGRPIEVEEILPTPEGEIRVASVQFPLLDEDGRPIALCGISLDITARVRAESVLAARERHYRQILDNLRHGVMLLGPDGELMYANPSARWMWGIDASRMPGLPLVGPGWSIYADDGREMTPGEDPLTRSVATACPVREQVIGLRRGAGHPVRWLTMDCVPVFASRGDLRAVVVSLVDSTDRVVAQALLAQSEALHRTLVTHLPDMVAVLSEDGRVEYISGGPSDRAPGNLVGAPAADFVRPEQREGMVAAIEEAQATGRVQDLQCNTATGADWHVRVVPLSEGGDDERILIIAQDVTDRKRAEEALRASEAEIQRAQRLESLTVLAGGVAHDFNNLLMGVIGNADLAAGLLPEDSPARPLLDSMMRSALAASDLSRQMLAFSGHGRFVARPLNVARHLADIRGLLESSATRRGALSFDLASDLPPVQADPTQVTQIALNLVVNAVEALPDGHGRVSIECGLREADRHLLDQAYPVDYELPEGQYVCLRVADDGHGMARDEVERAVEPFYTTRFAGRGLGLAVTLGLVRAHRGALILESTEGVGTVATVLLPPAWGAAESPEPEEAAPDALRGTPLPYATVLVADDEPVVLEVARMALAQAGYRVVTAEDGEAAVAAVEEASEPLDLVILDMTMPRICGEEALRQIRRRLPDVPVIVSTGYSESEAEDRFSGLGIAGYLPKPYRPSELIAMVRGLLER